MVPLISLLLYEFVFFSCVFFRPRHDCRLALLSTWVLKESWYVLCFPKHVAGVSNGDGNDNCFDRLAQAPCDRNL